MSSVSTAPALNILNRQYEAPAEGATVTVLPTTHVLMLNPAGPLASVTVVLPSPPVDGQDVVICTSQVVTSLTMNGTIVGTLTSLALGGFSRFVYSTSGAKWMRAG